MCLSSCGSFGIAGTSGGLIHVYNMQSGRRQTDFPLAAKKTFVRSSSLPGDVGRLRVGLAVDEAAEERRVSESRRTFYIDLIVLVVRNFWVV